MTAFLVRRLILAVVVVLGVTVFVFIVTHMLPGDPALIYVASDDLAHATPERIAEIREEFGLDRPLVVQYFDWLGRAVRGDLGRSIMFQTSVSSEIAHALPRTFHLGSIAFILSVIVGTPLGIIAAVRRGKWADTSVTIAGNLGVTVPIFWVGIMMMYLFGVYLSWLPIQGYTPPSEDFWLSTRQIIMPALCLSLFSTAANMRQTRSAMLEVVRQDYIRTAWAKGLSERLVIMRHALKNGLIPVITLQGFAVRLIFGGQVLIENVFNIPGMGRLAVEGLRNLDYSVVQGCFLVVAIGVVFANLAVDITYGWLDPRIRYE